MTTIPPCPSCGGPYLEEWRWAHVPLLRCPIHAADDATQAADAERAPLVRPSTATEGVLWHLVTGTPVPADAVTVVHAGAYWSRAINGYRSAADAAASTTPDPEGEAA